VVPDHELPVLTVMDDYRLAGGRRFGKSVHEIDCNVPALPTPPARTCRFQPDVLDEDALRLCFMMPESVVMMDLPHHLPFRQLLSSPIHGTQVWQCRFPAVTGTDFRLCVM
jgi:hypothetical protein